jgi:hypothetical protein
MLATKLAGKERQTYGQAGAHDRVAEHRQTDVGTGGCLRPSWRAQTDRCTDMRVLATRLASTESRPRVQHGEPPGSPHKPQPHKPQPRPSKWHRGRLVAITPMGLHGGGAVRGAKAAAVSDRSELPETEGTWGVMRAGAAGCRRHPVFPSAAGPPPATADAQFPAGALWWPPPAGAREGLPAAALAPAPPPAAASPAAACAGPPGTRLCT